MRLNVHSNSRFPFPSFFFLDVIVFSSILFPGRERVFFLFFLAVIGFFSWSLSWLKACFLPFFLSCFLYKFPSQIEKNSRNAFSELTARDSLSSNNLFRIFKWDRNRSLFWSFWMLCVVGYWGTKRPLENALSVGT